MSPAATAGGVRPVVVIDIHTQYDNLGDDVIVECALALARARADVVVDDRNAPAWVTELLSIDDEESMARSGRTLMGSLWSARFHRPRRRVVLLLKPGHIGGSYRGRDLATRLGLLVLSGAARICRVHVARVGFSLSDLSGTLRTIERWQSRLTTPYLPRDRLSDAYARELGFAVDGESVDLAFSLPLVEADDNGPGYDVTYSLRSSTHGFDDEADYEQALSALVIGHRGQLPSTSRVLWCSQVVRDDDYARTLAPASDPRITFDRTASGRDEILASYGRSRFVLTNRLHAFLFALSRGSLPVVLTDPSRHAKLTGLVLDLGLEDLLIDTRTATPSDLAERLKDLDARRPELLALTRVAYLANAAALEQCFDGAILGDTVRFVRPRPPFDLLGADGTSEEVTT